MSLVLPVPSSEPGPAWASELITAMGLLDAHNHTSGKGLRISQDGILFTADFSANSFGINSIKNLVFLSQINFDATYSLSVNVAGNLVYVDGAGNIITLTANGNINAKGINGNYASDPAFPSVYYTTSTRTYTFTIDGFTLGNIVEGAVNVGTLIGAFSSRTIAATEPIHTVLLDTSSVTNVITLPLAATVGAGRQYTFADSSGQAATRNITVNRAGANTINGAVSVVINTNRGVARIVSDGVSNWVVI